MDDKSGIIALKEELETWKARCDNCNSELQKARFDLGERQKELRCLHQMSDILTDPGLDSDQVIESILNIIPPAFQFPSLTMASIKVGEKVLSTTGFRKTALLLQKDFSSPGGLTASVQVALPGEDLPDCENIFLPEESDLLYSIISRLGNYLEKNITLTERLKSEGLHYSILSAIPDAIAITDFEGIVTYISPSGFKMFGLESSFDYSGLNITDFIVPEDHAAAMERIKMIAQGTFEGPREYTGVRGDKSRFPVEVAGQFIYAENDNPAGIIFVVRDITQKDAARKELEKSQRSFRDMVENINDVVYEVTFQGIINYVSPSIERVLGYKPEELTGKNFFHYMYPDDRPLLIEALSVLGEKDYSDIEYRYYRKDGALRWVRSSTKPVYNENSLVGGIGVLTDINERKTAEIELRKREQALRNLLNSQTHFLVRTDLDGVITYTNRKWNETFSWLYGETGGRGEYSMDSICSHHHERTKETVIKCIENPGLIVKIELDKPKPDGSILATFWEFICLTDENGNPSEIQCSGIDISDLKWTEKELSESREKYRSLIESTDSAIMLVSREGVFLYLNSIAAAPYGLSPEAMTGWNIKDTSPAHLVDEIMDNIARVLDTNAGLIVEAKTDLAGEEHWVRTSCQPVRDDHGIPYAVLMYVTDITSSKNAELLVIQNEKKYRALFHDSPDAYLISVEKTIIECNRELEKLLGGAREMIIGQDVKTLLPEYQPDGERSEDLIEKEIMNSRKNTSSSFEMTHLRFDGSEFLARIKFTVIDYGGKEAIFAAWQDITEIRNAEENVRKLSQAVDQSPVSIMITDIRGVIEYANPKTSIDTGYSNKELLGKNPMMLNAGTGQDISYEDLWTTIQSGREWHGIFHNRRKDGTFYWDSTTISPMFDQKGHITHYLALKEDITDKRRIQEELEINEKRHRQVAEHSRTVIWEVDITGLFTYISDIAEQVYGYSSDELTGKKYFFDLHPEENREEFKKTSLDIIINGRAIVNFDNPVEKKDGSVIWVSTNGTPIHDTDGSLIGYRGADTEITERKLAMDEIRKFRTALDQATYGASITTLDGTTIYLNKAWAMMHGYTPEECIGNKLTMYHNEDQLPAVGNLITLLYDTGSFSAEEVWHTRRDGSVFPSLMNGTIVNDENGKPMFMSATMVDITEIVRAQKALMSSEEKLREQNQRLSAIFEANPDLIFVIDTNGRYLESYAPDPSLDKLLKKQVLGKTLSDLYPEDEAERHLQKISECLNSRTLIKFTNHRDDRIYEQRLVAMGNDRVIIFARDITDDYLKDSEIRKLSTALEQSPVTVVITDLNGNIEYVNQGFTEITGYTADEAIGQNPRILKSGHTPPAVYENLWSTITAGKKWIGELLNKKKNGEEFWETAAISPIHDQNGNIVNYLAVKQDITEKKRIEQEIRDMNATLEMRIEERTAKITQSEQKFSAAFQAGSVMMAISELETGIYVDFNSMFEEALGFTREELLGKSNGQLGLFVDPGLKSTIIGNLKNNIPVRRQEIVYRKKDGSLRTGLLSADLILVGGVPCMLSATIDITERKAAEEELVKARYEAINASRAKSEFLANMSHEIRTPMNAILGYSELLAAMVNDNKEKEYLNSIKTSGRSLLTLINDILDLSKIEAGKLELEFDFVETEQFFNEFEKIFAFKTSEKGLTFKTIISSGTPSFVYIDGPRLRQVLLNLAGNAVKFTNTGGIEISVTSRNPREIRYPNNKIEELIDLEINIIDTGIGIPEEYHNDIFESFIQVRNRFNQGGTGLGLAISKRLVELMGGNISVVSVPGKGSTFTVVISDVLFIRSYENSRKNSDINPANITFDKAIVLVIDDVQDNRTLLRDALRNTELTVLEAYNGVSALELMDNIIPDLIITDIRMPGMGGFELLEEVKKNERLKHIPVIAYSASVMKEERVRINSSEFADLLIKPVSISELFTAISVFLKHTVIIDESNENNESGSVLSEDVTEFSDLIEILEGSLFKTWESLRTRQPINEVRAFGKILSDLGEKHSSAYVRRYGEELESAAESFNIENILRLIHSYPEIVNGVKKQNK